MTVAAALPTLLRLRRRAQMAAMLLGCRGDGTPHEVPQSARDVADLDWSVCPLCLLRAPHLGLIAALDRMAKVTPLSGWPDRYVAWAVLGVLHLREEATP